MGERVGEMIMLAVLGSNGFGSLDDPAEEDDEDWNGRIFMRWGDSKGDPEPVRPFELKIDCLENDTSR